MKKKAIIQYIKNGVEYSVCLNRSNYKKIFNDLFQNVSKVDFEFNTNELECYNSKLVFNGDVDFVSFKNISFKRLKYFDTCNSNFICICDECRFYTKNNLVFMVGMYELINPIFDNKDLKILGYKSNVFFVDINKGAGKDITINFNNSFGLYNGLFDGNHSIVGKNENNYLVFDDKIIRKYYFTGDELLYKDVVLCFNDANVYFQCNQMNVSNFKIKTRGKVFINDNEVRGSIDNQGYFVISDEDILNSLAKSCFTSVLKAVKSQIEYQKSIQIDKHLKKDMLSYFDYENKMMELINEMKRELINMDENIRIKRKKINKSLNKKNIGYFNHNEE